MSDLLQAMQKEVDAFVENYRTDFTVHDKKHLLEKAKTGERYYWLIRQNGTQLYNEKDLIVASDDWNERELLYYFRDYKKKLFIITIASNNGAALEGALEEVDYNKTCEQIKQNIKMPQEIKITFKEKNYWFDWQVVGSPNKFLHLLSYSLGEQLRWGDFYYEFIY